MEKTLKINTASGEQHMNVVNESGLYKIFLKSNKQTAIYNGSEKRLDPKQKINFTAGDMYLKDNDYYLSNKNMYNGISLGLSLGLSLVFACIQELIIQMNLKIPDYKID